MRRLLRDVWNAVRDDDMTPAIVRLIRYVKRRNATPKASVNPK